MANDDIIPINVHGATLDERTRTLKDGTIRHRTTVTVKSQPIACVLDEQMWAVAATDALVQQIRAQTKAIKVTASPATLKARRNAEKAVRRGEAWALKRYGGEKNEGLMPNRTPYLFNDSGRLGDSIVAQWQSRVKSFVINHSANRWNAQTFGGSATMQAVFQRWVSLVPVFRSGFSDKRVDDALKETVRGAVVVGKFGQPARVVVSNAKLKIASGIVRLIAQMVAA